MIGRIVTAFFVTAFLVHAANAVIQFKITKSTEAKQLIAIVPFGWQHSGEPPPVDIATIVADDLARSGLFEPIPFDSLPSRPHRHEQINFQDWRLLGPGNLVIGNITPSLDGEYVVEFQIGRASCRERV